MIMDGEKKWWASRSIWSLVIAVGCIIAGLFGIDIDEATKQALIDNTLVLVSGIGTLGGIIGGIIFRVKAKNKLTK